MGDGPDLGCAPAVTFVADGGRFVVRTRIRLRVFAIAPSLVFDRSALKVFNSDENEKKREGEREKETGGLYLEPIESAGSRFSSRLSRGYR